jgi:hypothetical protein
MAKRVSKSRPWGLNRSPPPNRVVRSHKWLSGLQVWAVGLSDALLCPLMSCHMSCLNQSDRYHATAQCHVLIVPSDPGLGLSIGLHIRRVRHGLERSREHQISRTPVLRPPSDLVHGPTSPCVALVLTHTRDTKRTMRTTGLTPPQTPVWCCLLSTAR